MASNGLTAFDNGSNLVFPLASVLFSASVDFVTDGRLSVRRAFASSLVILRSRILCLAASLESNVLGTFFSGLSVSSVLAFFGERTGSVLTGSNPKY